jgi:anti-sigma-K factor RskA
VNCEAAGDLLAAYAVDALSAEELAAVDAHLEGCRRHDDDLLALREAAGALAYAVPAAPAPAGLRARVLDAFERELDASRQDRPRPVATRRRWAASQPAWLYAAAAAVVLALAGMVAWNVALRADDGDNVVTASLPGGGGRIVYVPGEDVAVLDLSLPDLPPGRTYQAWAIGEGGVSSLGLVQGDGVSAVSGDLSLAQSLAISDEPAGGSEQPTTAPLATVSLR